MKKEKRFLPLYKRWMRSGKLGGRAGLCNEFGRFLWRDDKWQFDNEFFPLMTPDEGSIEGFWASDIGEHEATSFGSTRQNIVLFMAAMNGEL